MRPKPISDKRKETIDSAIIEKISRDDYHSSVEVYKLDQLKAKLRARKLNNLKGATPWKFMPEYQIELHQKDSVRAFKTLGEQDHGEWQLGFGT